MNDSVEKIITSYFAGVTLEPFTYKNKEYFPKSLVLTRNLLRGYSCNNCGGCCGIKFSLDYLPSDSTPKGVKGRIINFNGRDIKILSDMQENNDTKRCQYNSMETGYCTVHTMRPFSCDFELTRFTLSALEHKCNYASVRLYGRGWNLTRIDGQKGAKCEIRPMSAHDKKDLIRKFLRLQTWCEYFGIKNKCKQIIEFINNPVDRIVLNDQESIQHRLTPIL